MHYHLLVWLLKYVRGRTLLTGCVLLVCLACAYATVKLLEARAWGAAAMDGVLTALLALWLRWLINRGQRTTPLRIPAEPGDQPSPRPIE